MEKREKKDKDDKQKEEKEKEELLRLEISAISDTFDKTKMGIKLGPYLVLFESILEKWKIKIKDKEISELLGSTSAKILDYGLKEKELANFADGVTEVNKSEIIKVIYAMYDRISKKLPVFGIKSTKLFSLHTKIIQTEGIGTNCRAMFSIQK